MKNLRELAGCSAMGDGVSRPLTILAIGLAAWGCQNTARRPAGPLIVAASHCEDINFPIYFEPRSSAITPEAASLIAAAKDQARGCKLTGIVVVGLADAPGGPDANLELSKRRAKAVAAQLNRRGFTNAEFREGAVGAAGASTPSGADRPLRRRADVSIHLANRP
jgi:outer membrane protein OmpA-like peptidoglycan-associated protein